MAQSGSRAPARARPAKDRTTLYEEITNKIIAELVAGRLPWVQPWGSSGVRAPLGLPKNAATCRAYSGINVLILWSAVVENGFMVQSWLTFKQALALGGYVRKGERGTIVVYADRFVPDDVRARAHDRGQEPRAIPFLKRFTVFNAEQCEGLPDGIASAPPTVDTSLILPQAEQLIRATGADIRIGGDRAYYDVAGDFVRVPPPQAFFEPINFSRTLTHELGHWSGAGHRLNRDLFGSFGSKIYLQEELCAEICSAYVCAALGIVPTALKRHLLTPDAVATAVEAYRVERQRLSRERTRDRNALEREISEVGRHIDRMIASIKDGVDPKLLVSELNNAQAKREALERQLRLSDHPDVAVLHPQAAAAYRQKVVHLQEALARGDAAALEAVTLVRGMVCEIRVTPGPERMELEVVGDLAALLEQEQGPNKRDFISGCGGRIWAKALPDRVSGGGLASGGRLTASRAGAKRRLRARRRNARAERVMLTPDRRRMREFSVISLLNLLRRTLSA